MLKDDRQSTVTITPSELKPTKLMEKRTFSSLEEVVRLINIYATTAFVDYTYHKNMFRKT